MICHVTQVDLDHLRFQSELHHRNQCGRFGICRGGDTDGCRQRLQVIEGDVMED